MKITKIQSKKFLTLKMLDSGTEGQLYPLDTKEKWNHKTKLFKRLFVNEGRNFSNKMLIVTTLIDNVSKIDCESLGLPESLGAINNNIEGFIIPYYEGPTLDKLLDSNYFTSEEKIETLKKVGLVLEDMVRIRKYTMPNFFIGDLHEKNFIVTPRNQGMKIKTIDLDSAKVEDSHPLPSKYLSLSKNLEKLPGKYIKDKYDIIIPDENTDIFCYNTMILNYISGTNTASLPLEVMYSYLNYLSKLGYDKTFIDIMASMYSNAPNQSCMDYLDTIPKESGKAYYKVFEYNIKNKKI